MKRTFLTPIPAAVFLFLVGLFAFVPNGAASDFFLHSSTNDFLDNTSPTATTAKFKDSAAVNRTTYQEIGTWAAAPAATWMRLGSLSDLHVWIGLKNSDDQGTYFDLRTELRKNGVVIASGETKTIQGVTRNPANAKEVAVAFGPISGDQFNPGDVLSIKILTKVADSGGHNNAVGLRLYYDAVSRPSSFGAVFVVDTTPPTIAAVVNPAPNAAGWHKSDPTVSFTCADSESGVASCPAPITVSTEGANQLVSGTATDLAGNSASTSVLISLDKTAPTVAISSPANGSSFTSSPVNVTGTATDGLSGIATVLCNGSPATLSTSTYSCDVPLNTGPNTITAEATDVAGNTGSSSITVTRKPQTAVTVTPEQADVTVNQSQQFTATVSVTTDQRVTWAVSGGDGNFGPGSIDATGLYTAPGDAAEPPLVIITATSVADASASGTASVIVRDTQNFNQSNANQDLRATNRGDSVQFWWINLPDATTRIILSRSSTPNGTWTSVLNNEFPDDLTPSGSIEHTDIALIPTDTFNDYFYKLEAFSATGDLLKSYAPVFVPKFVAP